MMEQKLHNCVNPFHNYVMLKIIPGLSLGRNWHFSLNSLIFTPVK